MSNEASTEVREAVMAQVAELQSALAPLGVAFVRDHYVADEMRAGLRGVEFLDHDGTPIPSRSGHVCSVRRCPPSTSVGRGRSCCATSPGRQT